MIRRLLVLLTWLALVWASVPPLRHAVRSLLGRQDVPVTSMTAPEPPAQDVNGQSRSAGHERSADSLQELLQDLRARLRTILDSKGGGR